MVCQVSGNIFDIRRFSTHDGDGIRTTVFLKGCPLKCRWCQNPEGISAEKTLIYFENRCIRCGICKEQDNNKGFVSFKEGKPVFDREACPDWESYIEACPANALAMDGTQYTVSQVMAHIRKDIPFYHHGGGITLSGGEPLLQLGFSKSILLACKEEGIHTAMETSLYASHQHLKEILPFTEMIFADFKVFDEETHLQYTGVSNSLIKNNIELLLRSPMKKNVTVRTPLIPGLTAFSENIKAIARYIMGIYPEVNYELLNYNPLAMAKYPLMNKKYCFAETENPEKFTQIQMEEFYEEIKEVRNAI